MKSDAYTEAKSGQLTLGEQHVALMNHDTPEAIAITDKAAKELLEVEKLKAVNAELLESLQMFMKAGVGNSSDHGMQCCAANLAKAAIAKALGE